MKKSALLASSMTALALLQASIALAFDPRTANDASQQRGTMLGRAGKAVPFGGAYSPSQVGKRPEDLKRPSSTSCALHEQTRGVVPSMRQDASGKIRTFGDPSANKRRNGDIYADCTNSGDRVARLRSRVGSSTVMPRSGTKTNSAYNRNNTLKAASDGYVNRSASSSMMPKKAPTMYDPATGILKPSKTTNAYQIYQQ
ncbi:MAG TPA: hypothetical protein PKM60_05090 [Zoogloea sp.]|uniref:hypothetical protein n=1 Tax=Zoogloea sp. TaxID=49181 RepID=UPI002C18D54B|nr:hypothetical protein [Zoogloea sp.]HOB45520.1 hypothetical protein [Zoogloea sp.]HQA09426.1 hypothetical protein [Zoogloea sp.]HQE38406.1 hypothetical protein [Zoogloea sp.]